MSKGRRSARKADEDESVSRGYAIDTAAERQKRGRKPWKGCCADNNEPPRGGDWARWPKDYRKRRQP